MKVKWIWIAMAGFLALWLLSNVDFSRPAETVKAEVGAVQGLQFNWLWAVIALIVLIVVLVILAKKGILKNTGLPSKLLLAILFLVMAIGILVAVIKPDRLLLMAKGEPVIFFVCLGLLIVGIGFWKLSELNYPVWFAFVALLLVLPIGLARTNPDRTPSHDELETVFEHECYPITDPERLAQFPSVVRAYDVKVGLIEGGVGVSKITFTAEDEGYWCLLRNWQGWWCVGDEKTGRPVVGIQGEPSWEYGDNRMCTSRKWNVGGLMCWIGTPFAYDMPRKGLYSLKHNPYWEPSHPDCFLVGGDKLFPILAKDWLEWLGTDEGNIVLCGNESENGYNDGNNLGFVWGELWILRERPVESQLLPLLEKSRGRTSTQNTCGVSPA